MPAIRMFWRERNPVCRSEVICRCPELSRPSEVVSAHPCQATHDIQHAEFQVH